MAGVKGPALPPAQQQKKVQPQQKPATAVAGVDADLLPSAEDLLYEEELLRNPYALKMWVRYIAARSDAAPKRRYLLYERALRALPGSYKLWSAYLKERCLAVRGLSPLHPAHEALCNTFERALVSMHKMPRIWLEYLEHLSNLGYVTRTRRAFDRALASLPITQHDRIWVLYLKFICQPGIPVETAVRVYRRYLKLEPTHAEEYIAYLRIKERWGDAARQLAGLLNDDMFRSLEGRSKHQMWLELCDMVTKHPRDVEGMRVDAIIRGGIRKFTDEVGRLWASLADYYIRRGMFERARDVYEEGMASAMTVHDFSLIYDAYTQFEESLLSARMEQLADEEDEEEEEEEEDAEEGAGAGGVDGEGGEDFLLKDDGKDIDMRLARLEFLMTRRPELLSSVILRQNPHNVAEWHKRVKLFEGNPGRQILTYTEAVKTVDPDKATGKLHTLWVAFAKFYERHGDVPNARVIFEKATQARYKYVDDLAAVWAEWVEMELRHQNFRRALELCRASTKVPQRPQRFTPEQERALPVQERLYRSVKLWGLYVDLEESLGTHESVCGAYDQLMELRLVSPQLLLNYAHYLQENKYWEDSFKVYEKGIALFKYPHVRDIWASYLKLFVERYGGKKLERARDLFEQALREAPQEEAKPLYLEYAKLEEQYGLAKHAMDIYERGVRGVPKDQRGAMYDIYLARANEFFGIAKVREVFETAIEAEPPDDLADADVRELCMRYAALERKLGEIDRARAIFVHASALADPRHDRKFWAEWKAFEVAHGNEDTFREMLRIQRSVAASFSHMQIQSIVDSGKLAAELEAADNTTSATTTTAGGAGIGAAGVGAGAKRPHGDAMAALEAEAAAVAREVAAAPRGGTALSGFVSAGIIQQGKQGEEEGGEPQEKRQKVVADNPEEIDLDMGDDDDGENAGGGGDGGGGDDEEEGVQQKSVPSAVFGSLAAMAQQQQQPAAQGAMERLKAKR